MRSWYKYKVKNYVQNLILFIQLKRLKNQNYKSNVHQSSHSNDSDNATKGLCAARGIKAGSRVCMASRPDRENNRKHARHHRAVEK